MKRIQLTRGAEAIVDDEDYERLTRRKWAFNPEGVGYAVRKGSKRRGEPRTVQMHREVMHAPDGSVIDHINGNGLDNRKKNLRYASTQQNAFNKRKTNIPCTSSYKGVFMRTGNNKWTARIRYNGRRVELGKYTDEKVAASVYNFASRIFFGEYRRENTGPGIRELSHDFQTDVFNRCQRYIDRYGWYVDTETYRLFFMQRGNR
ncbi:MAG: HNH endonuclease [Eubacterium sp.]|jgi:hypothetical protein|nr:HNH endonuclease [Eubacterium sp.]MCH4078831.1 HNH endonuclease [Eubacterium sp.]